MGGRDRQKHIKNLKGKQKEENIDRNSDSKKIAAFLPVLLFCTDPSSSSCFMSSDQFFPHNPEKGNPFCFFGGFRTKLQASIQDVWNKGDDCFVHLGKLRQHGLLPGRPGFYLLPMENRSPSSAWTGLEKGDRHQDQEKVPTDQFCSVVGDASTAASGNWQRMRLPTERAGGLGVALTNQS